MDPRALGLELRNCGTVAHRVEGYPVVRVPDDQRRPINGNGSEPVSAADSYDAPPRPAGSTGRLAVNARRPN